MRTSSASTQDTQSPGIHGESPRRGDVHQLAEELLPGWRVTPQQGLMREGLLDLARHPVVGINHALGHSLVDLQRLPGDQSRDVPLLVQLGTHLRTGGETAWFKNVKGCESVQHVCSGDFHVL